MVPPRVEPESYQSCKCRSRESPLCRGWLLVFGFLDQPPFLCKETASSWPNTKKMVLADVPTVLTETCLPFSHAAIDHHLDDLYRLYCFFVRPESRPCEFNEPNLLYGHEFFRFPWTIVRTKPKARTPLVPGSSSSLQAE